MGVEWTGCLEKSTTTYTTMQLCTTLRDTAVNTQTLTETTLGFWHLRTPQTVCVTTLSLGTFRENVLSSASW